ncbi:cysteine protease, putative [Plasmodium knowlesi strain H]|uniref:Cysteine protease, putative n=3 Tax=Plasmodium knowlesi TaxID=5850 RepID=A0A1A7VTL6_PLAKH|nr:cysteine protease, putative [Plasmodium knowlesi strain H]OTN66839.1 putative Cysteine protease [Plasmodium knowlesi]CAA9986776.1 cysteine protease, putative [Plasmodium knowlesi strain H]SBO23610.1 cysteine protease, putative [Plasmodium knowlesi strain H]SBO25171.1 cysteine protease, putative [Plasmodium knowlesi strain H]VVS76250.1 cysteine protease, putative [Plasmodium knowlesi strain H]
MIKRPVALILILAFLTSANVTICETNKVDNVTQGGNGGISGGDSNSSPPSKNNPPNDGSKNNETAFPTKTISFNMPSNLEGAGSKNDSAKSTDEAGARTDGSLPSSTNATEKSNTSSGKEAEHTDISSGEREKTEPSTNEVAGEGHQTAVAMFEGNKTKSNGSLDGSMQVESALLKNYKGIKVTGPCGSYFRVYLVPHILIYALTKNSIIQIESLFDDNTRIDFEYADNMVNKCEEGKNFKLILYLKDNILTLKWNVLPSLSADDSDSTTKADVRKYKLPSLERPFTSIQVYTADAKEGIIETKNYALGADIPDKCNAIATDCFLNGNINIDKCYQCTLLVQNSEQNSEECFNYVSKDLQNQHNNAKVKGQDDLNPKEYELTESIDIILKNIYKVDKVKKKKVLIGMDDLDDVLKVELLNYCKLLKEMDVKGTLDNLDLGDEIDIFNNMIRLLSMHPKENIITLQDKLRNTAICLKNVDDWIENKRGLLLPDEDESSSLAKNPTQVDKEDESDEEEDHVKESELLNQDMYRKDKDGTIDLVKAGKELKLRSPYFKNSKYCNYEYCDRWKDKTSCISNIEVEEQGNCGLCWIFASKLHLETIRCMRGYGHFRSSALYVANCSRRNRKDICEVGSSPTEFLQIVRDTGFLPLESDHPYLHKNAGNECPKIKENWINLWGNSKLLSHKMYGHFMVYKGLISYQSRHFKDNMHIFIDLVKREVQNKGSVIIYIKTKDVIGYDFNGNGVQSLCGDKTPDHGANIVGYGNYINVNGEKRSYWLIRNSWGYYWGNEGTFKVDMHGPPGCKYNFIHTAVVFKVNLGAVDIPNKDVDLNHTYFPKHNADFFHSLYFNNYDDEADNQKKIFPKYRNMDYSGSGYKWKKVSKKWQISGQDEDITEGASSEETSSNDSSVAPKTAKPSPSAEKKIQILHVLKHIDKAKIMRGLVKYENISETQNDHSCARAHSKNPEKIEECKLFCEENWNNCKNHYSPGYCLSKLYSGSNCYFCYV